MNNNTIRAMPRRIGFLGAFLIISASALLGAYYGFTLGSHLAPSIGLVFAAAALGGELLKPLAVLGAFEALRSREILRALLCSLMAVVCVAYSFTAELSLAAGGRGDMASERGALRDNTEALRRSRTRAERELQQLTFARPVKELEPFIAKLSATPGANGCATEPDGPISRKVCGKVAELRAEAARSKRRYELDQAIVNAGAVLSGQSKHVSHADPLASALSAYATASGHQVAADTLAPWLALIPVLFLELGSSLALVIARSIDVQRKPKRPAPRKPPSKKVRREQKSGAIGGNVVELLKIRGGEIKSGQRGLAKALGVSKSRVNEILHELASAGQIALDTTCTGTRIKLVAA